MSNAQLSKRMRCACCGEGCLGRQWWNRDTGYGLCCSCHDELSQAESPEEMQNTYGVKGVHCAIPEPDQTPAQET